MTESNKALNIVDRELSNTTARVQSGNNQIAILQRRVEDLKNLAEELRGNATDIQARDVEGELFLCWCADVESELFTLLVC